MSPFKLTAIALTFCLYWFRVHGYSIHNSCKNYVPPNSPKNTASIDKTPMVKDAMAEAQVLAQRTVENLGDAGLLDTRNRLFQSATEMQLQNLKSMLSLPVMTFFIYYNSLAAFFDKQFINFLYYIYLDNLNEINIATPWALDSLQLIPKAPFELVIYCETEMYEARPGNGVDSGPSVWEDTVTGYRFESGDPADNHGNNEKARLPCSGAFTQIITAKNYPGALKVMVLCDSVLTKGVRGEASVATLAELKDKTGADALKPKKSINEILDLTLVSATIFHELVHAVFPGCKSSPTLLLSLERRNRTKSGLTNSSRYEK